MKGIFEAIEKLIPKAPPVYYIVQAKDGKLYTIYGKEFSEKIHKLGEGWRIVDLVETLEEAKTKHQAEVL
jgi:hypothetical protein